MSKKPTSDEKLDEILSRVKQMNKEKEHANSLLVEAVSLFTELQTLLPLEEEGIVRGIHGFKTQVGKYLRGEKIDD